MWPLRCVASLGKFVVVVDRRERAGSTNRDTGRFTTPENPPKNLSETDLIFAISAVFILIPSGRGHLWGRRRVDETRRHRNKSFFEEGNLATDSGCVVDRRQ
jgi:hypothetical protein